MSTASSTPPIEDIREMKTRPSVWKRLASLGQHRPQKSLQPSPESVKPVGRESASSKSPSTTTEPVVHPGAHEELNLTGKPELFAFPDTSDSLEEISLPMLSDSQESEAITERAMAGEESLPLLSESAEMGSMPEILLPYLQALDQPESRKILLREAMVKPVESGSPEPLSLSIVSTKERNSSSPTALDLPGASILSDSPEVSEEPVSLSSGSSKPESTPEVDISYMRATEQVEHIEKEEEVSVLRAVEEQKLSEPDEASGFRIDAYRSPQKTGPDRKPTLISQVGLRQTLLENLALKTLYLSGPFSIVELGKRMKLSFEVVNELIFRLRAETLCQVTGTSDGHVPTIAITTQGRSRARDLLEQSQYVGATPVSFDSYIDQVKRQSVRNVEVRPSDVERAFSNLVIDDATLRQFGTALNSGTAVFIYGPAGVGKTSMAEAMARAVAEDLVWIPYAVEVGGQVVTVYDQTLHVAAEDQEPEGHDERWVLCHRPVVIVGGELTIDMLDLQFNPVSKFYVAPVQMKANNGVLIIDDFGRQRLRPEDLLNRWVVPLDRRIDFLTLAGGMKIEIPFEMLVVFASNIDPYELVDPAFLRRIQTKIKVGPISDEQFCQIFRRVATERDLEYAETIVVDLIKFIRNVLKLELRPCYPRDIANQVCWGAKYDGEKPRLDHAAAMRAVEAYFLPKS
jgi:hypothetical protein